MPESKFTPGPWGVLHDPNAPRLRRIGSTGKQLAIVSSSRISLAEIDANAELMADAPRMLEVLRNLLAYAEIPRSWDGIGEAEQAFTQAHEMLEKHCG